MQHAMAKPNGDMLDRMSFQAGSRLTLSTPPSLVFLLFLPLLLLQPMTLVLLILLPRLRLLPLPLRVCHNPVRDLLRELGWTKATATTVWSYTSKLTEKRR